LHDAVTQEVLQTEDTRGAGAGVRRVAGHDQAPGTAEGVAPELLQGVDLRPQLARQPRVVVVAEPDELAGGGQDARVARPGQARRPLVVGEDAHRAPRRTGDVDG